MAEDILEPIPSEGVPEGYVEVAEGDYTKVIQLDTPYEIELVDELASLGWLLVSIIPCDNKYVYWFQSKKKVYINSKQHL